MREREIYIYIYIYIYTAYRDHHRLLLMGELMSSLR